MGSVGSRLGTNKVSNWIYLFLLIILNFIFPGGRDTFLTDGRKRRRRKAKKTLTRVGTFFLTVCIWSEAAAVNKCCPSQQ